MLTVKDCPDRDETIMRLAFFAAQRSSNAVIQVEVTAEKVRNGAYQTSKWSGFLGFRPRLMRRKSRGRSCAT